MQTVFQKLNAWLLSVLLILFALQMALLPHGVGLTWADRSDAPGNVLTYSQGKLRWDDNTHIRPDGTARLDLFDPAYQGVTAADGDNLVAPGTQGGSYVRLKNSVSGSVKFTAVLYEIKTDPALPVKADLAGSFQDTSRYSLPAGVSQNQVLRAVSGTLRGRQIQDFDIAWDWDFEGNDSLDTDFGNADPADRITLGLYIVVEDGNSYVTPDIPQTGDDSHIQFYACIMVLSGGMLIILLLEYRCRKVENENAQNAEIYEQDPADYPGGGSGADSGGEPLAAGRPGHGPGGRHGAGLQLGGGGDGVHGTHHPGQRHGHRPFPGHLRPG